MCVASARRRRSTGRGFACLSTVTVVGIPVHLHSPQSDGLDPARLVPLAQGGIVTREAASRAGISDHWLGKWVRQGTIARLARGVYSIGDARLPPHEPAVIAASWRVVLSHFAAAAWWGLDMPRTVSTLHV